MIKASIPWNTKQVHKMVMNNSLRFDNAIQRGDVWDKNRQSLLIDSILRNYPIPPFYTIKDGRTVKTPKGDVAVFDALDGKQRCLTITKFKNNEFALCNLDDTILDEDGNEVDLNGLTYDELPDSLKDAFDSYSLTVYYFTDITEEEVTEIMSRLNNGKPLTAAENTRIKARDLAGIKKLADHQLFTNYFSEKAINGYQNEDTVIKMYSVLNGMNDLDNKDIKPLYEELEITPAISDRITAILDRIDEIVDNLIGEGEKAVAKKLTTRTHLISIAKVVEASSADGVSVEDMASFFTHFFKKGKPSNNEDYNAASSNGVNHENMVDARLTALDKEYKYAGTVNFDYPED